MDAEITAMGAISDALEPLDTDARSRVLQWASAKYSVKLSTQRQVDAQVDESTNQSQDCAGKGAEVCASSYSYDTLADLFAAASPAKDPEKVLVAAYWHQVVKGQTELTSAMLNKDLTNLGHRITNINEKFDALIGCKPQLALQLKKSGSTKQARKQYKISQAGIDKVKGMLRNQE